MNSERIDIHAHYYPRTHLKLIEKRVNEIYLEGAKFPAMEKMYNLDLRLKEMRESKVDKQILSVGPPGVDRLDRETAIAQARICNDEIAGVVKKNPESFEGVAILPLQFMDVALEELNRAINELGLKGVMINSNVNRKPLDSPEFFPFYNKAGEMGVPVHIHPTVPTCTDFQKEYGLYIVLGFIYDSSLAMLRLILSGVLSKFPKTKFILSHLGGVLPYLAQRIDDQWQSFPPFMRGVIDRPPTNYFRNIYVDTVNNFPPAYALAKQLFGTERIMFGTDYPFLDSKNCVTCVANLNFGDEEKTMMFSENARKIFNI